MRNGVMTKALMSRECGATGAMSPYPVVLSVTVDPVRRRIVVVAVPPAVHPDDQHREHDDAEPDQEPAAE
jgi:hypothetical protein